MYEISTVSKKNETKLIGILKAKKYCNSPGSPIMLYNILMTYIESKFCRWNVFLVKKIKFE